MITVVGNTEGSDSEELLGGVSAPRSGSPPESQPILLETEAPQVAVDASTSPTPATGNDEQPSASTTKQLSFEVLLTPLLVKTGTEQSETSKFYVFFIIFPFVFKLQRISLNRINAWMLDELGIRINVSPFIST